MESKATFKMPPVESFQPDVSCEDIKRQDWPNTDLLGAVVVGGRYTADCFIPKDADDDYDGNVKEFE